MGLFICFRQKASATFCGREKISIEIYSSHPPLSHKINVFCFSIVCRIQNIYSKCLLNSILMKSRLSCSKPSEEKWQPPLPWLPKSVHLVCLPRKLVTTSPKPLKIGKV